MDSGLGNIDAETEAEMADRSTEQRLTFGKNVPLGKNPPDEPSTDDTLTTITQGMIIEGTVLAPVAQRGDPGSRDRAATRVVDITSRSVSGARLRREGGYRDGTYDQALVPLWARSGLHYVTQLCAPRRSSGRNPNWVALLSGAALLAVALLATLTGVSVSPGGIEKYPPTTYAPDQPRSDELSIGSVATAPQPSIQSLASTATTLPSSSELEASSFEPSLRPTRPPTRQPTTTMAADPLLPGGINGLVSGLLDQPGRQGRAPVIPAPQATSSSAASSSASAPLSGH